MRVVIGLLATGLPGYLARHELDLACRVPCRRLVSPLILLTGISPTSDWHWMVDSLSRGTGEIIFGFLTTPLAYIGYINRSIQEFPCQVHNRAPEGVISAVDSITWDKNTLAVIYGLS